jgi:hypothetical protein
MDADQFYEKFKDAIVWFGLGWNEKHLIRVRISGNQLCFEHGGTEIRMTIPVMYANP